MWKVSKPVKELKPNQCPKVKEPIVWVGVLAMDKIKLLLQVYPRTEWIAYLVGEKKGSDYSVTNIIIPRQVVGIADAEILPPIWDDRLGVYLSLAPKRLVGIIHSHHTMGAFHSGTDQEFVDKNYPISITVAKVVTGIAFDTRFRQKIPCGDIVSGPCTVKQKSRRPGYRVDPFLQEAKDKIKGR